MHEKTLSASAAETIALMRLAHTKFKQIDQSTDYTPEAKRRLRAELANELIGKLDNSALFNRAQEAGEHILQRYQAQIDAKIPKPTDMQAVGVAAQIRNRLAGIKDEKERLKFLERNGDDLVLIGACLGAPRFLTNLSDGEVALLRSNLERHAPSEIIEGRSFVTSALAELQRGQRAARKRLAKLGNIEDGSFGTPAWHQDATKRPAQPAAKPSTATPV